MNESQPLSEEIAVYVCPFEAIDASNSSAFKTQLKDSVSGSSKLILDLGNVQFVDSAGLGVMVWGFRQLSADNGEMRTCNVNGSVRALFELVRMNSLVEVLGSREEAVSSF